MQSQADYHFHLAMQYEMLGQYFKYTDPNLHIQYYYKHLEAIQHAVNLSRSDSREEYLDKKEEYTNVRVLHAVPKAPAVDIYIDNQLTIQGLSYKYVSKYLHLPAGKHTVDVYPEGTNESPIISKGISFKPNTPYTVAAIQNIDDINLHPLVDHPEVENDQTKLRFVHFSPAAPAVDVATKDGEILFTAISYTGLSNYKKLPPGKYEIQVYRHGTNDLLLTVPNLQLKANQGYSMYVVGQPKLTPSLEPLLLKDG